MAIRVVCFGAGGHAKVIIDALMLMAREQAIEIVGLIDANKASQPVLGVPVIGTDTDIEVVFRSHSVTHFVIGIGGVRGDSIVRPRLFGLALASGLRPLTVIHPSAVIASSAVIGSGAAVLAGAVIQAGARVGENAIVNTRASIDHDCIIRDHAHIAPGVTCSGMVTVGRGAHLGAGATIIEGVTIGDGATVGAGAVVLQDCAGGTTVYGVPARPVRLRHDVPWLR